MDRNQSGSGKSKKIMNRQNEEQRDELTEQVTETTFSRTRMVKRGACSTSDSDLPQIEWRTVKDIKRSYLPTQQRQTYSHFGTSWGQKNPITRKAYSNSKQGQYWKIEADENRTWRQMYKEKNHR